MFICYLKKNDQIIETSEDETLDDAIESAKDMLESTYFEYELNYLVEKKIGFTTITPAFNNISLDSIVEIVERNDYSLSDIESFFLNDEDFFFEDYED